MDLCVYLFAWKKRKLALSLSTPFLPPSFPLFLRLDYASRQMVPVCWLFSIHFLSSQTATLPPSALSLPPFFPSPSPSLSPLSPLQWLLCYVARNNLLLPSCSEVTSCPWLDRAKSYHTIVFELAGWPPHPPTTHTPYSPPPTPAPSLFQPPVPLSLPGPWWSYVRGQQWGALVPPGSSRLGGKEGGGHEGLSFFFLHHSASQRMEERLPPQSLHSPSTMVNLPVAGLLTLRPSKPSPPPSFPDDPPLLRTSADTDR